MVMITTVGFDRTSICWEQRSYGLAVQQGRMDDASFYTYISAADESDDWLDPVVWANANPNLDVTVSSEYIATEASRAVPSPAYQNTFRRLHLNQWTQQESRWLDMRAWAAFAKGYGPGARLYVHTDPTRAGGGLDLVELAHACAIPEGQIVLPDRYSYYLGYPSEWMALLYNAADVLLAASMSEGFGIPLIEAQACGTPVITTDWTSMPELVTWGHAVRVRDKVWSNLGGWWALPDVCDVQTTLWRMARAKQAVDAAESRSRASARMHALYGWDVVVEKYWQPVLEEVANVVSTRGHHAGAPRADEHSVCANDQQTEAGDGQE